MKTRDLQPEEMNEVAIDQLERQGACCVQVPDGHVFIFRRELLEKLLAKALESGDDMASVFVSSGAQA